MKACTTQTVSTTIAQLCPSVAGNFNFVGNLKLTTMDVLQDGGFLSGEKRRCSSN